MANVNTGTQRSMMLSVTKVGTDATSVVVNSSTPGYAYLDGRNAFGAYALIDDTALGLLSDADFAARVAAWKTHVQSSSTTNDPDMWADITTPDSFIYVNGVVVRLYDIGDGTFKTTVKGYINGGSTFSTKVVDGNGNLRHQFDINPGTTESSGASWNSGGTTLQQIIDGNLFKFLDNSTSYNHPTIHLTAFVDINKIYPIPV